MTDTSSEPTDRLDEVIANFLSAEAALLELSSLNQEIAASAKAVRDAEAAAKARSDAAASVLDAAAAASTQQADAARAALEANANLATELSAVAARVRAAVEQLQRIDPDQFARDLGELRRDISDQSVELREARRLLADLQRDSAANAQALPPIAASTQSTQTMVQTVTQMVGNNHRLLDNQRLPLLTAAIASTVAAIAAVAAAVAALT